MRTPKECKAKYSAENPEKMKESNAKYRAKNKEKISEKRKEKVDCICGSNVKKSNIRKHEKTKKHIAYIDNQ